MPTRCRRRAGAAAAPRRPAGPPVVRAGRAARCGRRDCRIRDRRMGRRPRPPVAVPPPPGAAADRHRPPAPGWRAVRVRRPAPTTTVRPRRPAPVRRHLPTVRPTATRRSTAVRRRAASAVRSASAATVLPDTTCPVRTAPDRAAPIPSSASLTVRRPGCACAARPHRWSTPDRPGCRSKRTSVRRPWSAGRRRPPAGCRRNPPAW